MHYAFDWSFFLDLYSHGARWEVRDERWAACRFHGVNKSAVDPAERRDEIARVLCEQWGSSSVQCRWARFVAGRFHASERSGRDGPRRRVLKANRVLGELTDFRVYS